MENKHQAFTLIELLVVVLIIGILAAIAVPQYEKAVEKSKATQALALLKSAYQAAAAHYMATGEYPQSFSEMGFEIPWTGTQKGITNKGPKDTKSNEDWSLQLYHNLTAKGYAIIITRLTGKYKGAGFSLMTYSTEQWREGTIRCTERRSDGIVFDTTLSPGDYCIKIMNGSAESASGTTVRTYRLPNY